MILSKDKGSTKQKEKKKQIKGNDYSPKQKMLDNKFKGKERM